MKPFQYANARTFAGAGKLYRDAPSSAYLGGGVDLLGRMKDGLAEPERVVNLKKIPESGKIERKGNTWNLGPGVTIAQLQDHEEIGKAFPGIAEAARHVGSPQIRNMGTLGGNLAQHSRCWYYRHKDVQCLKNGGDVCYASVGDSRYHSLFTNNACISPVVSNLATALAALDATVVVRTSEGQKDWTIEDLFEDAWNDPAAHHSLKPGDLIVLVKIPDFKRRSHYMQQSDKAEFDWALVSAAASARVEGGVLRQPQLVLGAIAPGPYQLKEVNDMLEGQPLTETLAGKAAERLLEGAEATPENAYKIPLAKAIARRCLLKLLA